MIRRAPRSTQSRSSAASDVYKRQHLASDKSSWSIGGNSGTIAGANYLGTSDNQELSVKTNNTEAVRINTNQDVGVGLNIPLQKMDVNGNINVVGDVNITEAGNVVVQPSTVFKIAQNKIIRVYGDFTASGSGIIFKPVDPNYTIKNYWKGIYTYSTGKTVLNNVRVEGANYGLYIYYGRGSVYNCTFYNNNYGLRILYPNSSFNIYQCTFTNNNTAIYSSSANVLVANSTLAITLMA